jgi:hypothetical protein
MNDADTTTPPLPLSGATGRIAFTCEVPEADRANKTHDIPRAYAVEVGDDIPGGCVIWGLYRNEWQENASGRWLVAHLLRQRQERMELTSAARTASLILDCAKEWEPGARLIGNVRADHIAEASRCLLRLVEEKRSRDFPMG